MHLHFDEKNSNRSRSGAAGAADKSYGLPTVNVVLPVTPEEEAEIFTVPPFFPSAMPVERMEARRLR